MYVGIEGAIKIAITVIILVFAILSLLALLIVGLRKIVNLSSKFQMDKTQLFLPKKPEKNYNTEDLEKREILRKEKHDEKIVAVISAALSSYMLFSKDQFKITKITRSVPAGFSPWTISGRQFFISRRIPVNYKKNRRTVR